MEPGAALSLPGGAGEQRFCFLEGVAGEGGAGTAGAVCSRRILRNCTGQICFSHLAGLANKPGQAEKGDGHTGGANKNEFIHFSPSV